jgi:hypothetical protein
MTQIFVVSLKKLPYRAVPPYKLVYVGGTEPGPGELSDASQDSIAERNPGFSELTAHYWVWKNLFPSMAPDETVGFCHYRRFPTFGLAASSWDDVMRLDCEQKIAAVLSSGHDVIMAEPLTYTMRSLRSCLGASAYLLRPILPGTVLTLAEHYRVGHSPSDLKTAIALLPPEHREGFAAFLNTKELAPYNMYIARKDLLNDYFAVLFEWLFAVEKKIDIERHNRYQRRVFGFLAERFAPYYFTRTATPYYSPLTQLRL